MQTNELKGKIEMLRNLIDQQSFWLRQATDALYAMEETLFDIQDLEYSQKYGSIHILKEAATKNFDCPPRHFSNRCVDEHTGACGFYQPEFDLKKIV